MPPGDNIHSLSIEQQSPKIAVLQDLLTGLKD